VVDDDDNNNININDSGSSSNCYIVACDFHSLISCEICATVYVLMSRKSSNAECMLMHTKIVRSWSFLLIIYIHEIFRHVHGPFDEKSKDEDHAKIIKAK